MFDADLTLGIVEVWRGEIRPAQEVSMLWTIIVMLIVGLIAGALARLLVPGKDPMGVVGTIVLGLVGSLVGGFLGYLLFHKDSANGAFQFSGLLGSIIGAVIVLLIYRAVRGRSGRTAVR